MFSQVLRPSCHIQNLHFWGAVYLSETPAAVAGGVSGEQFEAAGSDVSSSSAVTSPDQQVTCLPAKTRSCDDLTKAGLDDDDVIVPMMSAQRRLSDPNIAAHTAAADSTSSPAAEVEDEDDIGEVRTAVNCQQSGDRTHPNDNQQNETSGAKLPDDAAMNTVSLVAVSGQKCASNETLKAVEDETAMCDLYGGQTIGSHCDNKLQQAQSPEACGPAVMAMFQASSDTLTGEDGHPSSVSAGECNTLPSLVLANGAPVNTAINDEELSTEGVGIHSQVLKMKTMLDRCSSTSDISSSHVVDNSTVLVNGAARKAVTPLTVDTRLALVAASSNGTTVKGVVNGDGDGPGISQPPSRGSSSPPTPNSDVKVIFDFCNMCYCILFNPDRKHAPALLHGQFPGQSE